jgi:hypothetical protein
MMAHQFKEPAPIAELSPETPPHLIQLVERLMQKAPESRFASSAEVVEVLRPLVRSKPKNGRSEPRWQTPPLSSPAAETPPLGGTPRQAMPTMINMPAVSGPAPGLPRAAMPTAEQLSKPDLLSQLPRRSAAGRDTAAMPRGGATQPMPRVGAPAPAAQRPASMPNIQPGEDRQIPGAFEEAPRSWEERLGPIGIVVGTLVAAVLAWFVATKFF